MAFVADLDYTPGTNTIQSGPHIPAAAFTATPLVHSSDTGSLPNVYYVDHLDNEQIPFQTIRPENPDWWLYPRDAGTITYEISLGANDIYGAPVVTPDFIAPTRTGWQLRCGEKVICAGFHTLVSSELGSELMTVNGVTWEGYGSRRHFPFDPRVKPDYAADHVYDYVIGAAPTGLSYELVNDDLSIDVSHVVKSIFDAIHDRPNSLAISYGRLDLGYGIKYFSLSLGDTTDWLTILQQLANTPPGFDFRITPVTMELILNSPYRYGNNEDIVAEGEDGPDLMGKFTDDNKQFFSIEYTNTGPEKTHQLATGSGTSTNFGVALGTPAGNEALFMRLDGTFDAGQYIVNRSDIEKTARQDFAYGLQPVHEVPLSVLPSVLYDDEADFWDNYYPGGAIWVRVNFEMHQLNSPQRVISMHGYMDEGNVIVEFGLNQIYALDYSTVGVYEG